jgi:hypothetical protein
MSRGEVLFPRVLGRLAPRWFVEGLRCSRSRRTLVSASWREPRGDDDESPFRPRAHRAPREATRCLLARRPWPLAASWPPRDDDEAHPR